MLAGDGEPGRDLRFSEGLHCAACDRAFRPPTPNLFSFNSPLGACATCHGFGRTTGIDWDLVVPDPAVSLAKGAIRPFEFPSAKKRKRRLLEWAVSAGVDVAQPWRDLPQAVRAQVLEGTGSWEGVNGWFLHLEEKKHRVGARVLLSRYRGYPTCPDCGGGRLAAEGRAWRVGERELPQVLALDVSAARAFFDALKAPPGSEEVVDLLLREIRSRLGCLEDVGLGYVTLDRQARTLSGGEIQRVNLTAALGTNLVNTLFVLDEPSIGLHPRDNERLVGMLRRLCLQGNTVVVVEHDPAILAAADYLVDLGPGAGAEGGRLVAAGTPAEVRAHPTSLTGAWLSGRRGVASMASDSGARTRGPEVGVRGARAHNLKGVDLLVRLGELTVLSGVSGSGKSSLARDVFHLALAREKGAPEGTPGAHDAVVGAKHVDEVVLVDQTALSGSSRANPATFVGAWDGVRARFASEPEARRRDFTVSTFSFNVPGGRCERCTGEGREHVEMQFLSDVQVTCEECGGRRFRPEVLEVRVDGLSAADVLGLTVSEAVKRFAAETRIARPLRPLEEVGLGYLRLGQPLSTLSAGEAQRLRLAAALAEPAGGTRRMYVFDEPTTGLHLEDVAVLIRALRRLADRGHGVLLGGTPPRRALGGRPRGGPRPGRRSRRRAHRGRRLPGRGGAQGHGDTARFLKAYRDPARFNPAPVAQAARRHGTDDGVIRIRGAREHNLKNVDVDIPRDAFVAVSGPSGSGKSTLAFDIVFAEGQRRYIETLSAYARQFVGQLGPPDVDHVAGIPPTVAIEQRRTRGGRRSTVATVTEVAHFLRLLFARAGVPHCPLCKRELRALSADAIRARLTEDHKGEVLRLFAPVVLGRKGFHREVFEAMTARGHVYARVDGRVVAADPPPTLGPVRRTRHRGGGRARAAGRTHPVALAQAMDEALKVGQGTFLVLRPDGSTRTLSVRRTCPRDGTTVPEPDPRFFSHNSRRGWCPECSGLGVRPSVEAERIPIDVEKTLKQGAIPALHVDATLHRTFVKEAHKLLGRRADHALGRDRHPDEAPAPEGRHDAAREVRGGGGAARDVPRGLPRHRRGLVRRVRHAPAVPHVRGRTPAPRGARGRSGGAHAPVDPGRARGQAGGRADGPEAHGPRRRRGRADPARGRGARRVPRARGPRLPHARPRRDDALGRRVAAHPARGVAGEPPPRRAATCSTSPRSGCTRATTAGCSTR